MNKSLLIVASLALGTGAIAQNNPAATGTGDPGASQASQSMSTPTPAEQGSTPSEASQTPGGQTAPTGGDMSPQGATPPAGGDASQGGGAMQGGAMSSGGTSMQAPGANGGTQAGATDTSNYPKCGKGVTDKCVQAGGAGTHHATHRRATRHHGK